jgi:hypothetical protein
MKTLNGVIHRAVCAMQPIPSASTCTSSLQAEIQRQPRKAAWVCTGWNDCPAFYSPKLVDCSASIPAVLEPIINASAHRAAQRACSNTTRSQPSGGWCLARPSELRAPVYCCGRLYPVNSSRGVERRYYLPSHHYPPDARILRWLHELLHGDGNTLSLIDMGAGVGQYCSALLGLDRRVRCASYDGAGNVAEITNGFVTWVDMTTPLTLPRADWVMSLEVGEHIPNHFEPMFIRNLHAHACRGILLSWGHRSRSGPRGQGHDDANYHSKAYLVNLFAQLGYRHRNVSLPDYSRTKLQRGRGPAVKQPEHFWFDNNMVGIFERILPLDCTHS